jgi:hypothetical protein
MLRFSGQPDERSLAILHEALTYALDWFDDHQDSPEDFTVDYPESARCFTPALAEKTLKDLLRASQDSVLYQLTNYHWLLLYEVLKNFTEVFNDDPEGVGWGQRIGDQV